MLTKDRLDVLIMPRALDCVPQKSALDDLILRWQGAGILSEDGRESGPEAHAVFQGGFKRLSILNSEKPRFVANQIGGFRVFCGGQNITGRFVSAMGKWRSGGTRDMECVCGQNHPLEDLNFRPPAGFYRVALEFRAVGHAGLAPEQQDMIEGVLGPIRMVYRRVG